MIGWATCDRIESLCDRSSTVFFNLWIFNNQMRFKMRVKAKLKGHEEIALLEHDKDNQSSKDGKYKYV